MLNPEVEIKGFCGLILWTLVCFVGIWEREDGLGGLDTNLYYNRSIKIKPICDLLHQVNCGRTLSSTKARDGWRKVVPDQLGVMSETIFSFGEVGAGVNVGLFTLHKSSYGFYTKCTGSCRLAPDGASGFKLGTPQNFTLLSRHPSKTNRSFAISA